ncbi:MAG TPA: DUF502 domain-containing protein [Phycisphaerae bacterium]|nr:DUF502 domain-containing protein [Phycisphaerae bacterium]
MSAAPSPIPGPPVSPEADVAKAKRNVTPRSIRGRIFAGLLLIVPLAVTFWLISFVYAAALWVGSNLIAWIAWAIVWAFGLAIEIPEFHPDSATWYQSLIAVVLTIVTLYLLGWIGTNAVGVRIIGLFEWMLERIPLVETIYVAIKRIVQALSGAGRTGASAQRVVLIDFPHENMRALAFLTNVITDANSGQRYATVFVPTTPNPTSGYMELVPVERITPTNLTMEAGLSMVLSGGASAPTNIHLYQRGTIDNPSDK